MSETSNDVDVLGYALPQDDRQRLAKLGQCIRFLARLAQPGSDDPLRAWTSRARLSELASGLQALAQQLDQAPGEGWPASSMASPADEEGVAVAGTDVDRDGQHEPLMFGMTMDQLDALDRLIQLIRAHGDVVSAHRMADLAGGTVAMVGHAIFDEATEVRRILDEVEDQRWPEQTRPRNGVDEERATYAAEPAGVPVQAWPGVEALSAVCSSISIAAPHASRLH
jgi:hypothetical protein